MKKLLLLILCFFSITILTTAQISCALERDVKASLKRAIQQYKLLDKEVPDTLLPRSVNSNGTLMTSKTNYWTSGFFSGSLWYLYQFSKEDSVKRMAIRRTREVEKEKWNSSDHDIGFKIMCSFGNALRITKDTLQYAPVIVTAAKTLIKRFKPVVGAIRSGGSINDTTEFRVIIDNMMNLELLFAATRLTKDSSFYKIAVAHADKTLANHFRSNGSSYHLVNYNPKTGAVIEKKTVQGYRNESAWARGQAWGLYGYTLCYRETKMKRYLDQANKIAQFLLKHPNLPKDKIPYWDFDAPDIPYALQDASAAGIIASALLELSKYTSGTTKNWYCNNALLIISNLNRSSYRTYLGEKHNFLLKHSVGHFPAKREVDVPLIYADYYYVEAIMRYQQTLLQLQVLSFTLIDANTDQAIQTLSNGVKLNLANLPGRYLNIRANTNPFTIGSVIFNLTGAQSKTVTENIVPYALYGDNGSVDYYGWMPAVGSYTLKGTPYSSCNGTGTAGKALTINFTIIDQATATNLSQENNRMATYSENEINGLQAMVYPNPNAGDKVSVEVRNLGQPRATLLLLDIVGRVLDVRHLVADGQGNAFAIFSFNQRLQPGLYLLELQSTAGKAQVKLVVK